MPEESTDWIVPGAKVVLYYDTYGDKPRHVKATTIAKVAKKSFTVEEPNEPRFSIETQKAHGGGTWHSWTRCCVPYDSEEAQREFVYVRDMRYMGVARTACETWLRSRTRENRLAAITALQRIPNDDISG